MSCVVYRFYGSEGDLLYVGSTGHWPRRMQQHQSGRPWWAEVATVTLEHFANLDAARSAELRAIIAERPAYTLPPATSTGRAWQATRIRRAERHAAGEFCGNAPCVECRLRHITDLYREKVGRDLAADVLEMRAVGSGRETTARVIRERLGLRWDEGVAQVTTGMVERIERLEAEA